MKGRALSTGCPGLYLYAVKDSRVPPEIDLIYAGPFPRLPIKSTYAPARSGCCCCCCCCCCCRCCVRLPRGIQIPFPSSRKDGARHDRPGILESRLPDMAADKSALISRDSRAGSGCSRAMNYAFASYVGASAKHSDDGNK